MPQPAKPVYWAGSRLPCIGCALCGARVFQVRHQLRTAEPPEVLSGAYGIDSKVSLARNLGSGTLYRRQRPPRAR